MAKQKKSTGSGSILSLNDLDSFLSKDVNPQGSLINENTFVNNQTFISTGIKILDAMISTHVVGGGIPSNKMTAISGLSGCLYPDENVNVYFPKYKSEFKRKYYRNFNNDVEVMQVYFPEFDLENGKEWKKSYQSLIKKECELLSINVSEFQMVASENSITMTIEELIENYSQELFFIDTPDGYIPVGNLFQKTKRQCLEIKTSNHIIRCSKDHLIETSRGWILAKDLIRNENIKVKSEQNTISYETISEKSILDDSIVYDFEVLSPNHRYWGGTGISSHNTGKTFLALNVAKNAQAEGYFIIYLDSEGAVDMKTIKSFGIDPTNFRIDPIVTVEQFKVFMAKLLKKLEDSKEEGMEIPKIMIILDSLGNLASDKEVNDAEDGDSKGDMGGRTKVLKSVFRIITNKLSILSIPMLVISHSYLSMTNPMYPVEVISGGNGVIYNASIILMLSKAKLKTGEEDQYSSQSGIIITARSEKNRLAKPKKIKFELSFMSGSNPYTGLDQFLIPENFHITGIAKGKPIKTVDASTGEIITTIQPGGNFWYIKHLDKSISGKNLFSREVFTDDVLSRIEMIAHDYFRYPTGDEILNVKAEEIEDDSIPLSKSVKSNVKSGLDWLNEEDDD